MTSNRTILITGVTAQQGGAVAQALKGTGFHLRGLTRKPDSERAAALARHGIDVVKGDLDDEASLRRALAGVWGVFGVQNAAEADVEREETQGKRLATLAREAGVEHYVYTSVGSAHKRTGVPHFDNKWRIEETVRGLRTARSCFVYLKDRGSEIYLERGAHPRYPLSRMAGNL